MARQTQDSLLIVGVIAAGITVVAFLVMMVIGGMSFSPAAFLSLIVGLGAAIVLYKGFHDKVQPPAAAQAASKPAAAPASAPAPKPAAPAPEAAAEPAPAATSAAPASEPVRLDAARDGKADDLKKIKGVGPKLEAMLNRMGFFHFDQIANWTDAETAWVDDNLESFNGRATRDDWRGQAKELAAKNGG